jgi:hypothetical protein
MNGENVVIAGFKWVGKRSIWCRLDNSVKAFPAFVICAGLPLVLDMQKDCKAPKPTRIYQHITANLVQLFICLQACYSRGPYPIDYWMRLKRGQFGRLPLWYIPILTAQPANPTET